jgi:predicted metal-dependent phosphoesterase TrpH
MTESASPALPIRADLHNHTYYSPDSILSPEYLLRRALERRIDVIAVTDHNTVRGGLAVQELAAKRYVGVRVIVGEEVRTRDGEVLGLFLTEDVPRGLSARETVERIKIQGGIAGAPHPYDSFRSGLQGLMDEMASELDFVEGLNARMIFRRHNKKAREFAQAHGLPMTAASDAHSPREIGRAYVRMPGFTTPAEFLASLSLGRLTGRLSSPFIHWISRYATLRTRTGWRPPE